MRTSSEEARVNVRMRTTLFDDGEVLYEVIERGETVWHKRVQIGKDKAHNFNAENQRLAHAVKREKARERVVIAAKQYVINDEEFREALLYQRLARAVAALRKVSEP